MRYPFGLMVLALCSASPALAADNCLHDMAHAIVLDTRLTAQDETMCLRYPSPDQARCANGDGEALEARIQQRLADVAAAHCEAAIIR